jgi:hypothetical protein
MYFSNVYALIMIVSLPIDYYMKIYFIAMKMLRYTVKPCYMQQQIIQIYVLFDIPRLAYFRLSSF